jgi:hypothetical protein
MTYARAQELIDSPGMILRHHNILHPSYEHTVICINIVIGMDDTCVNLRIMNKLAKKLKANRYP